jgi:hypothetical protein
MKLLSLKLPDLPLLGSPSHFYTNAPPNNLRGWSVKVRGRAVFLVSPPGWEPGKPLANLDPKGARRTVGPLEAGKECVLFWEGGDVDAVAKYDGDPMGAPLEPVLSDEEIERATAPRKAAR